MGCRVQGVGFKIRGLDFRTLVDESAKVDSTSESYLLSPSKSTLGASIETHIYIYNIHI